MKLKDNKNCICKDVDREVSGHRDYRWCRAGQCTICLCWTCGLPWVEWGPVTCPHKKNENGTLRWFKYPDMDVKTHVAVKKNKLKRQHAYPKRSWREKCELS